MEGLAKRGSLSDNDLDIHKEAGILFQEGKILKVGSFGTLKKEAVDLHEIDFPAVALPGLIDCHTHLPWGGSRAEEYSARLGGKTYQEIAKEGGGILNTVRETRKASEEQLIEALLIRLEHQLSIGITTCEVKSGYGLNLKDELKILRAIEEGNQTHPIDLISTCLAAHVLPPEFSDNKDYLAFIQEVIFPEIKKKGLTKRIDIFVEKGAFSVSEAEKYLSEAKNQGFSITLHGDQFSPGGSKLAAELQASSVDHLEEIDERGIEALKKAQTVAVVLPGASLGLGIHFAPARKLLDHGLTLAIASDWNPGSAPMGDLMTQTALLGAYEKLSIVEMLAGITVRAARALELSDRGELKPKSRADFTIYPAEHYAEIFYRQGALKPCRVYIEGREVYAA